MSEISEIEAQNEQLEQDLAKQEQDLANTEELSSKLDDVDAKIEDLTKGGLDENYSFITFETCKSQPVRSAKPRPAVMTLLS